MFQHNLSVDYFLVAAQPIVVYPLHITHTYHGQNCYLYNVIDVYLAILVFIQCVGDAEQLMLWNALDLPHNSNELIDANQILPKGKQHAVFRKHLDTKTMVK